LGRFSVCFLSLLPKPAAIINALLLFLFNEFSIFSICSSSRLFSLIDLISETILGLFSIYSPISGATLPLEIPAKSLRTSILIFNNLESFFITICLGAERFSFSISFKYEAATPIFVANSL